MVKVQTGGKLYIAGEYAILYPGQVAILKNIPIYMTALATFADNYSLYSDMFNYTASLQPDKQYSLIQET
ncbi:TPA: phosphomevalonate kinase, partial [Streptococcus agalactiae]